MALGAEPRRVLLMIAREDLALIAAGVAVGVPLALGGAQTVRSLLFGLEPIDLTSILVAAFTMMLAGLLAGLVPAWRAARVQPTSALRAE